MKILRIHPFPGTSMSQCLTFPVMTFWAPASPMGSLCLQPFPCTWKDSYSRNMKLEIHDHSIKRQGFYNQDIINSYSCPQRRKEFLNVWFYFIGPFLSLVTGIRVQNFSKCKAMKCNQLPSQSTLTNPSLKRKLCTQGTHTHTQPDGTYLYLKLPHIQLSPKAFPTLYHLEILRNLLW